MLESGARGAKVMSISRRARLYDKEAFSCNDPRNHIIIDLIVDLSINTYSGNLPLLLTQKCIAFS